MKQSNDFVLFVTDGRLICDISPMSFTVSYMSKHEFNIVIVFRNDTSRTQYLFIYLFVS